MGWRVVLVDDAEHRGERKAHGLGGLPAREALRFRVDEGDTAPGIGGDDGVADAGQGDGLEQTAGLHAPPETVQGLGQDADEDAADDEHEPLDEVGRRVDGEGVGGRDQEKVHAQGGRAGGDQAGPQTAQVGAHEDGEHQDDQ